MLRSLFKFEFNNYWRNIDKNKKIFIKIDLEGYDFNAIYGSKNLLNNYFTIILFEFSKIAVKNEIYSKENFDKFLIENSDLRHVVRRAFIIEKFPYSEIQDNTISISLVPIDMLRLKLSFFGAVKFDPRSDKWLRICMFQGAPLPTELKSFDKKWIYNSLN